jgi:hypothetical protein
VIAEAVGRQNLVFVVNTQQEYWRREFKGQIHEKDSSYQQKILLLISQGICPVFQIDDDSSEFEFLASLPENSIIVWCHSDERYDLNFNKQISQLPAVRLVLRPYRLHTINPRRILRSLIQTTINLQYASNFTFVLRVIRWQIRGLEMAWRQFRIVRMYKMKNKEFLNIPIGYTNIFAVSMLKSFNELDLSTDLSLFDVSERNTAGFGNKEVSFSGQVGQVIRETSIRAARKFPQASIICRTSYGASNILGAEVKKNGLEYISMFRDSKAVLCPPGNISGESFRIFETVLMGRIPLAMNAVTSDPNYFLPFKNLGSWNGCYRWGSLISTALATKIEVLDEIVRKNFIDLKDQVRQIRHELSDILNK